MPSVLIVDDEPNIAVSLDFLMRQQGYAVRTVHSGEAALAALAAEPADVVLLDVMLPDRDGLDVCQTIRANTAWKQTRVLMVSAKGRPVDEARARARGADGYVVKPFAIQDVVARVRGLVEAR
ncbi:MAG: response regulator transcription factor [Bacteroidota bacterium]